MKRRILFSLAALGVAGVAVAAVPRLVPQEEAPTQVERHADGEHARERGHHGHHAGKHHRGHHGKRGHHGRRGHDKGPHGEKSCSK